MIRESEVEIRIKIPVNLYIAWNYYIVKEGCKGYADSIKHMLVRLGYPVYFQEFPYEVLEKIRKFRRKKLRKKLKILV